MQAGLLTSVWRGYLEWARLEAGLADGDKTLPGEEYGENEEAAICICPEDAKELLCCSGGDLTNARRAQQELKTKTPQSDINTAQ